MINEQRKNQDLQNLKMQINHMVKSYADQYKPNFIETIGLMEMIKLDYYQSCLAITAAIRKKEGLDGKGKKGNKDILS